MATLYDMQQDAANLYALLQSGEIDEQTVADTLEAMMVPEKLEGYCQVIRQLTADSEAYANEEKLMTEKKAIAQNAIKRMKERMSNFLQAAGQKKMKCGLFTISLTKGESVSVDDLESIPKEYFDPQPDKLSRSKIKSAIKSGVDVPGASISVNYGCSVR